MLTPPPDTQTNLAALYGCKTESAAQELIKGLPLEEQRRVLMLADSAKVEYLQVDDESLFRLSDPNGELATQTQINELYASLFSLIKSAKQKSNAENKALHIIIGEAHSDRTGLLVSSMILHIGKRLGIDNLGIELFPEESIVRSDGIKVLGFPAIQRIVNKFTSVPGEIDEEGSTLKGAKRKNCQFQMFLAKNLGITSFCNDPQGKAAYKVDASQADIYDNRESPMTDILAGMPTKHLVSIYGYAHLSQLEKLLQHNDAHTLLIDTSHLVGLCITENYQGRPNENLANAVQLPATMEQASELGRNRDLTGATYVQVPGKRIETGKDALGMAKAADLDIGKKLAPTWEERMEKQPRGPIIPNR